MIMYNDIQSKSIGAGTRIWQYTVVLPGARIGCNCNINAHCFVENDVKVGDRVLFGKYSGTEVKVSGQEVLVMREEDIMGVIE